MRGSICFLQVSEVFHSTFDLILGNPYANSYFLREPCRFESFARHRGSVVSGIATFSCEGEVRHCSHVCLIVDSESCFFPPACFQSQLLMLAPLQFRKNDKDA
jgi:hypothetical protein